MARIRKEMTPVQFANSLGHIAIQLNNVRPMMVKFGARYQKALRKNLRSGKQATGKSIPKLTDLTLQGKLVKNERVIGDRSSFGDKPLYASGNIVKNFVYKIIPNGFILANKDLDNTQVVGFHTSDVGMKVSKRMQRHLAARHKIFVKIGSTITRPARIPFALNSRRVKKSVTDLNKFIFKSILR